MGQRFVGNTVVITGASMGLGRALALEFAREGANLVLAARSEQKLHEVAAEVECVGARAIPLVTDVAHRPDLARLVERTLEKFERLDVLVNNAGYGITSFLEDVPPAELERLFKVNVFALVDAVQLALPALTKARGVVVNVGSVIGRRGVPPLGAYCMTKAAVGSLSETLRAELGRFGVHVLHVEPGLTATRFADNRRIFGAWQHPRTYGGSFSMSAETVARRIVAAAASRRDRVTLGLPGKAMIAANTFAPWLLNRILRRAVARKYGSS